MRRIRAFHKLAGIIAGPLIIVAATTALGLNHPELVRGATAAAVPNLVGPFGRFVLAIATDPRDARHLFVGTADGLFRSDDGGAHWEEAVLPVPAEQVGAIAFDPTRPGVVYVAFRSIGVWRSADGGVIWEDVPLPFAPHEGVTVAGLTLTADGALVLATPRGIWRQAGPGGTWASTAAPPPADNEAGKKRLQLFYDLHDGRFWRDWGVPVTDAVSIVLLLLVLTGYGLAWITRRRRRPGPRTVAWILALGIGLSALPADAHPQAPQTGPGAKTETPRADGSVTQMREAMGTFWTLEVSSPAPQRTLEAGYAAIRQIDAQMSTYKPTSELSRLNREGHRQWVRLGPETAGVAARALGWARATEGAFDPTVAPLVDAWGFKWMNFHLPAPGALAAARAHVGWRGVRLSRGRARFDRPGMALDLGGIAKGTAIDASIAAMRAAGATRVRVDAGGQQGVWSRTAETWQFALAGHGQDVGLATLGHGSIATSGDAERGFILGGTRYGHILDPRTGWPAKGVLAVSVVAPTAEAADALSTALYVMGPDRGRPLVASLPGVAALWTLADGSRAIGVGSGVTPSPFSLQGASSAGVR